MPFEPVETIDGDPANGFLLVCDHARNTVPPGYDDLGLNGAVFERHIAYDIGARAVTLKLAAALGAPAVLSCFSRLVIDPNRGLDDPTLVMRLSDGAVVPGNARITPEEKQCRIETYYVPYHDALADAIDRAISVGTPPALVSIHSFTPSWKTFRRPWHIGVLWDRDPRLAVPLIAALQADRAIVVGDNEPYSGQLAGDTMFRHGTGRGLAHALIELRQDLVSDDDGVSVWADRLIDVLKGLRHQEGLNTVRHYGSASGHGTKE